MKWRCDQHNIFFSCMYDLKYSKSLKNNNMYKSDEMVPNYD